jgi:hypothetical protein
MMISGEKLFFFSNFISTKHICVLNLYYEFALVPICISTTF